jgi:hypothetical protein
MPNGNDIGTPPTSE